MLLILEEVLTKFECLQNIIKADTFFIDKMHLGQIQM